MSYACGTEDIEWKQEGPDDKAKYNNGPGGGQINRITYDPKFNTSTSGILNQTVYAGSFHGGLWKSTDNGEEWEHLNTDDQLPQTSVSGIAVGNNVNENNIFISTGAGGNINFNSINPLHTGITNGIATTIFTSGVYRSTNGGDDWVAINNGLLNLFNSPVGINNIKVDPTDDDILFIPTSEGIYKTTNALSATPSWSKATLPTGINELMSSLIFHPTNHNIIYAAGSDIVKSINNGTTWSKVSGTGTNMDFSTLSNNFTSKRVNLAVSEADPDKLYVYLMGQEDIVWGISTRRVNSRYIYTEKNGVWTQLFHDVAVANPELPSHMQTTWMGIAVAPNDANKIFFGSILLNGDLAISSGQTSSFYGKLHNDIHEIVYTPNQVGVLYPDFMIAHHGGISQSYSHPLAPVLKGLKPQSSDINTSMLWGLDVSSADSKRIIIGRQDNGSSESIDGGTTWSYIDGSHGDGYGVGYSHEAVNPIPNRYAIVKNNSPLFFSLPTDADYVKGQMASSNNPKRKCTLPSRFTNKTHPLTNKKIFGFSELWSEWDEDVSPQIYTYNNWKIQSDVYDNTSPIPDESFQWKGARRIVDFEIAASNPNYIYIVTFGRDGIAHTTDLHLFTTGLSNNQYNFPSSNITRKFDDITANLPRIVYNGVSYDPYITGIAVSKSDHKQVWICLSGYSAGKKVYFSNDAGTTWVNADPNGCLPNLPMNSIVYQDGSDDRLYLAADNGLYVSEGLGASLTWKKFENLPNVMVHNLKINECSNRIFVGTYGRGVWSAELLPTTKSFIPQSIISNTLWDKNRVIPGNIKVTSGNKLTITSTIYMPANGRIIVEPNAILEIDGGTITNSCGNSWGSISLEGSNAHDQFPLNHPTNQAKLVLKNNALLDNVQYGITFGKEGQWSDFGGLVQAEDATIRCTRRVASFMSYPYANHSTFRRCTFEYVTTITDPPISLVTIWDNSGIGFEGCTFADNSGLNEYTEYGGNGIFSIDATYAVRPDCNFPPGVPGSSPCPGQYFTRSSFNNLNQGIYVSTGGGTPTIDISETNFYDNSMAMRVEGVNNVRFVLNTVLTGGLVKNGYDIDYGYQMGFYANTSSGYEIEQNTFEERNTALEDVIGVNIINSGAVANEVYNNTFKNNTIGEKYYGLNRNFNLSAIEGLQFLCNDNLAGNDEDVEVNKTSSPFNFLEGVRDNQGSSTPANSASNLFLNSGNLNIKNNSSNNIAYHYNLAVTQEHPSQVTTGLVSRIDVGVSNTCPDRFWNTGPTGGVIDIYPINSNFQGIVDDYYDERNQYNDLLYTYFQNIDNGNTDSLLTAIGLYFPGSAQAMRDDLISQSPYLSEQALRDAAESGILTDALLLEVCLANPDATNNEGFLDLVEFDIPNPLPSIMVQLIYQSWGGETPRTILENQLADLNADLGRVSTKLIHLYEMDSLNHTDSIRNMLESQKTLKSKYQLAELEVELGNFSTALTQLTAIENNNALNASQVAEHHNMEDYVNFRKDLQTIGTDYMRLNETQLVELRAIANLNTGRSSLLAKNILCFGYQECDFGSAPQLRVKSRRTYSEIPVVEKAINSISASLSPNPANNIVKIELEGLADGQLVQLSLKNTSGQVVLEKQLNTTVTSLAIDHLTKGVYLYEMRSNNERISTGKLIVQ